MCGKPAIGLNTQICCQGSRLGQQILTGGDVTENRRSYSAMREAV